MSNAVLAIGHPRSAASQDPNDLENVNIHGAGSFLTQTQTSTGASAMMKRAVNHEKLVDTHCDALWKTQTTAKLFARDSEITKNRRPWITVNSNDCLESEQSWFALVGRLFPPVLARLMNSRERKRTVDWLSPSRMFDAVFLLVNWARCHLAKFQPLATL